MSRNSVGAARSFFVAAVAGFVLLLSGGTPPHAAPGGRQISQDARNRAQRAGRIRVIVELTQPERAAQFLARLPPASHRLIRQHRRVPYLTLDVTPAALDAIETLDADVVRVMEDKILKPVLAESVPLIQGDQAWASGYDGAGTMIAILDTGVDATHAFLAGKVSAEACFSSTVAGTSESFCPNGLDQQIGPGAGAPCPMPDCLHGTHVAGIAAGFDATGAHAASGVAKGAQVMAIQVFSKITDAASCGGVAPCVGGYASDIIAALEHVYATALAGTYNIAAVNMSLGENLYETTCDVETPYKPAIDNLRAIGIASVVAAGNDGWPFGLSAPACVSSAVSVGATTKWDDVAWFSNVAPFLSLFAPGDSITSSVPGGAYLELSGTSMAAPHVAGAWGVLKQAAPAATVTTILNALRSTGLPVTDTRYGFLSDTTVPRVQLYDALGSLVVVPAPVPAVTALAPASVRAGSGAFTLTVSGSGFVSRSVVEWNGAARPTTFVNGGTLRASIAAGDVSAAGAEQVRVTTSAPGGGTSSSLAFAIDPPPALAVSTTSAVAGSSVTVTLTNGFGNAQDWIAFASTSAANTTYLQYVYVGAGATTRTWTIATPATPGTYEFRLFLSNGYTRAATSPSVTVTPAPPPALTVDASVVLPGGSVTVALTNGAGGATDWIAFASTAAPNTTYLQYVYVGTGVTARTWTVTAPASPGSYEFRLFLNNTYNRAATSPPLAVPVGAPSLTSLSPRTGQVGGAAFTLTVNGGGFALNSLVRWNGADRATTYVSGTQLRASIPAADLATPGTAQVTVFTPAPGGGASPALPFDIVAPPVLAVSATSANGGTPVTVTLTGGFGGSTDWIALAATSAANTSYVQYIYVGAGVTTRTWTVAMPATAGTYEFRLFPNNGYVRAATSAAITVTPAPPPALTVDTASIAAGGPVTVTLIGGSGNATDWLALAVTGAPNTSYVTWQYVGAGLTTRTWTVTMPAAGTYEFRLFLNNSYTRAATSPTVSVF